MMNNVNLTGRLVKDPELKYSPNGVAVCSFTVAVNRTFTNQEGEREADFPNVVCFNKTAENFATYMKKGSLVGVEGRLQTRNYEHSEGYTVWVTEVVANNIHFLESKSEDEKPKGKKQYNKGRR